MRVSKHGLLAVGISRAAVSLTVAMITLTPVLARAIPVHQWSKPFGSTGEDVSSGVAIDPSGNVFITGYFTGSVDFGGGALTNGGQKDIFLAKFDAGGAHLWSKSFGGNGEDFGYKVAVDASGNVIATGLFVNNVNFGGGNIAGGAGQVFLAKYDASGAHLWSKGLGGTGVDSGFDVAVDASGNVIVTGYFNGTANFEGSNLTSAGDSDIFVAKYNASGVHQWSQGFGGTGQDEGHAVAIDASGNVGVAGTFGNTVNFGGGNLISAGNPDLFLAKYDASGAHVWSKGLGGAGSDYQPRVVFDGSGNAILTGGFSNTVNFGGGNLISAGARDIFVAKYDASGAHQWSMSTGTTGGDGGKGLAVDASGRVTVAGTFDNGSVNFGGGNLTSLGGAEIFIARFSAGGTHEYSQRYGGGSSDEGYGVAVDGFGNVFLTGYFVGTANFGGGNHNSAGHIDIYLVRYLDEDAIPVLISAFDAKSRRGAVDVTWELWHDEDLGDFTLFRRHGTSPALAMVSGHAQVRGAYTDTSVEPGESYHYELLVRTASGDELRSTVASVTMPTASALLGQNRPNPFNPTTSIEYTLTERMPVVVTIFDAKGALVVRLDQGVQGVGTHRAQWDGRAVSGRVAASGVYFYSLEGVPQAGSRKMVLLK